MPVKAECVAIREPLDGVKPAARGERPCQFQKRQLTLAANCEIDVPGVQGGVGIECREISTPNHRHLRVLATEVAADRNGRGHLRSRHDGYGQQPGRPLAHDPVERRADIGIGIAVHNLVLFRALQDGSQR